MQLLDTECVECAETDIELFEEIEEAEEGRSHWKPSHSGKMPPWLLFQHLLRQTGVLDAQYSFESAVFGSHYVAEEHVYWFDSASGTYLFCGDSSPPNRV